MSQADILIVEDDDNLAHTLARGLDRLSGGGLKVDVCGNGMDAMERIHARPFDMVISDLKMPGISGIDLVGYIRHNYPNMIIILMTAYGTREIAARAARVADAYLPKPFNLPELAELIQTLLPQPFKTGELSLTRRILILEDEQFFRRLLGKALRRAGYVVFPAASIAEARTLLRAQEFDVFLCDVQVEDGLGIHLIRENRALLRAADTKVIMVTGESRYREDGEELGVDLYLEKPVSIESLITLVDRLISKRE
jgi:DNA-binding response OmpR family regulator